MAHQINNRTNKFSFLVFLKLYSTLILVLDLTYMVLKSLYLWIGVFYRTFFPTELEPVKGKIVLVSDKCMLKTHHLIKRIRSQVLVEALEGSLLYSGQSMAVL